MLTPVIRQPFIAATFGGTNLCRAYPPNEVFADCQEFFLTTFDQHIPVHLTMGFIAYREEHAVMAAGRVDDLNDIVFLQSPLGLRRLLWGLQNGSQPVSYTHLR